MSAPGTLRRLHDAAAQAVAWSVARLPALEQPFLALGRAVRDVPRANVFYGRAAAMLARRWARRGAAYRTLDVQGHPLSLDVAEFYAHDHYFHQRSFEPGLARFVAEWLRPGDTFVDAGANHGYFSLLAASIVGAAGRVVAFEPHETARAAMHDALARNRLADRVEVVPLALSDRDGSALMHQAHHTALASLVPDQSPVRHMVAFGAPFEVRTARFDGWRERAGIGRIRLMKIDVEGAERLVLDGMPATLRGTLDALAVETSAGSGADHLMIDAGYSADTLDRYPDGPENRLYLPGPRVPRTALL